MKRALVLYIPVIHAGYIALFKKYEGKTEALFILGPDFIKELAPLHEEIRALPPATIKKMAESLGYFPAVKILDRESLSELKKYKIVFADEEISRRFQEKYLPAIKNPTLEKVFLRWDEKKVQVTKPLQRKNIRTSAFDKKIAVLLGEESKKSPDWWRQVGAIITKGSKIILKGHNTHVPSEQTPYIDGDPRDFIQAGKTPELATAIHAEQGLIAEAAKRGISLEGLSIYVSAFPCPVCAKLIAYSGLKKCYFLKGSATLDGERVLKTHSVEIISL